MVGILNLADICHQRSIHLTNYGTGCIFNCDDRCSDGKVAKFTEADMPNPPDSFYLKTKAIVDVLLRDYDNVLNLRIRMPISDDLLCRRNLVTKLACYPKARSLTNKMIRVQTKHPSRVNKVHLLSPDHQRQKLVHCFA